MKRKWIGLMLCAALLSGCAGEAGPSGASAEVPGGGIQRMDIRQELEPVNTENAFEKAAYFGDMVYQCQPNQNTLVSPLSLDMALGLAAEGAAGDTAKELADYLSREDYGTFAKEYLDANEEYRKRFEGYGQNGYQVRLELDENGTKAAAVTAIMMETCEAVMEPKQVKTVYLDRPFAFLIYDEANQQILFVGKVVSVE